MIETTDDAAARASALVRSERLRLRAVTEEDLAVLAARWDDPALLVLQNGDVRMRTPASRVEEQRSWYANTKPGEIGLAVEQVEDGALVGAFTLYGMTVEQPIGTFAVNLLPAYLGRGLGTEAVRLAVSYCFRSIPLHRIGLGVYDFNDRARRCYEAAGFREEGRRRETVFVDGEWHDLVLMSVLRREWEAGFGL